MRLTAFFPVLCCTIALILSFLCLFAGHKKGFMEDYHLLTLNTSRLGEGVVNNVFSSESSSSGGSFLSNIVPNSVSDLGGRLGDKVNGQINDLVGAATERLGIEVVLD
jgi:hypothetical protein